MCFDPTAFTLVPVSIVLTHQSVSETNLRAECEIPIT